MKRITRRDFVGIAGAEILAGAVSQELKAQKNSPQAPKSASDHKALLPDHPDSSMKVADTNEDFAEDYFWIDDHTLLFLRLTPRKQGLFRAVLVDTTTGRKTLPQPFNVKNSAFLMGEPHSFLRAGSNWHWDHDYAPPRTTLSPDGQWLLWPTARTNPDVQWVAATLDGEQQLWKQIADPTSERKHLGNSAYWLHDKTGWVELVTRYSEKQYTLPRAHIYHLGNPAPVKTVEIEELGIGLDVGMTHDGRVMMYHPPENQDSITTAVFSLVGLEGDVVKPERLMVPIPKTQNVWEVTLSPQGDRLAWVLDEIRGGESINAIYVSNVDGTELRPIGTAPSVEISNHRYSSPNKVRWLPDGSRLSFRYNKGIHVVAS
jgi:hypothetical protein